MVTIRCHRCGNQCTPPKCEGCGYVMPDVREALIELGVLLRRELKNCTYRGYEITRSETYDGSEEYWCAVKKEWDGSEDDRPSVSSEYLSRSKSVEDAFQLVIDGIDRMEAEAEAGHFSGRKEAYIHPAPDVVHPRMIFWCWIVNDPFLPAYDEKNGDYYHCPLCDMVRDDTLGKDSTMRTWDYYHPHMGYITASVYGDIVTGRRPLLGLSE